MRTSNIKNGWKDVFFCCCVPFSKLPTFLQVLSSGFLDNHVVTVCFGKSGLWVGERKIVVDMTLCPQMK